MILDVSNKGDILAAAKAALPALKQFYLEDTPSNGAWNERICHWHESGIFYDLFYTYYDYSGDDSYNEWVDGQMQIVVGGYADFLDGNNPVLSLSGRWNDDIGWWGISMISAAEATTDGIIAPKNFHGNENPKYVAVANNTYYQMYNNWDNQCGGGIYWSRDRYTKRENERWYKSSITNAQHVDMGARLYALTGNNAYKNIVDSVYMWMKNMRLIDTDYTVYDGLDARTCDRSGDMYSYHTGELIAGLATLYKVTKEQFYLTEAHHHFNRLASYFAPNGILVETHCNNSGAICKSPAGFMWNVYKGLAILFVQTPDEVVKGQIASILRATAINNFKLCNADWYCIRDLPVGTAYTMLNGTNPRDQFETVSLLNALAIISGASTVPKEQEVIQVKSSTTPNANDTNDNVQSKSTTSGGFDVAKITLYAGLCVVVLSFIVVAFVYMRKKSQESARSKTMMPEIEYIKMEYGATTSRDMPRLLHQHNDRKRRNGWEVDRAARSRAKYDREMGKGWDEDRGATRYRHV